jgi:hypothetical protein
MEFYEIENKSLSEMFRALMPTRTITIHFNRDSSLLISTLIERKMNHDIVGIR